MIYLGDVLLGLKNYGDLLIPFCQSTVIIGGRAWRNKGKDKLLGNVVLHINDVDTHQFQTRSTTKNKKKKSNAILDHSALSSPLPKRHILVCSKLKVFAYDKFMKMAECLPNG